MRAPTFIGIGMQKSGTRWLYQQLLHHPAFRMPPMKEFHFFDDPFPSPKYVEQLERRGLTDPADLAFLERLRRLERRPDHPIETYLALFDGTRGKLTGEITPDYAGLPDSTIDRIADAMPGTRIVMMLRDPVSRAWSALNDGVNAGKFDPACLTDPQAMLRTLALPNVAAVSFPGDSFRRWSRRFDMACFHLDDVRHDPAGTRRAVLQALGADPDAPSPLAPGFNAKAGRPRAPMSATIRAALAAHFARDMALAARLIGGRAVGWPALYA
ncbi:MAG: sulfotransferase [Rubellimicrobium sp.]|nr:sulfotransferase [Rubellimicrobium sp.]